jgi:hypothetical protein
VRSDGRLVSSEKMLFNSLKHSCRHWYNDRNSTSSHCTVIRTLSLIGFSVHIKLGMAKKAWQIERNIEDALDVWYLCLRTYLCSAIVSKILL